MAERLLVIEILGKSQQAVRAFKETEDASSSLGSKFSTLGKSALALGGAAGLALVADGLHKCVDAALAEQAATAKLDAAFKAVGLSTKDYGTAIDGAESKGRQLGFTNVDVMNSLSRLIIPTKNTGQALRDLGIAEDLARFKHIDLAAASQMLAQAMTGSQRAARQLGITIPAVTTAVDALKAAHQGAKGPIDSTAMAEAKLQDKMATGSAIIDAVSAKVKGQGQAFADTAQGGMAQFSAQLDNLEAKIGQKLLPVFQKILAWVNQHWPEIASTVGTACTIIGKAIEIVEPIIKGMGTVILNMSKLVVDLIHGEWSKAWADFKALVMAPVNAVKGALDALWKDIEGPVSAAWASLSSAAGKALKAVEGFVNSLWKPQYEAIKAGLEWIRDNAVKAWGMLAGAIQAVWKVIGPVLSAMASAINAVVGALNDLINLAKAAASVVGGIPSTKVAPGPPGNTPGPGRVPAAVGARAVTVGMPYLVGESGPEIFTPSVGGSISASGDSGGGIHVHFHGTIVGDDRRAIADYLADEVYSALRRKRLSGLPALS